MGNTHTSPQAQDTVLTSTSELDSESVVAFNFGDSTGVLVILVIGVIVSFFLYQLFSCCMDGRCSSCSRQQRPNYDNQGLNSALITLALAVGHQQNVSQQQQHQLQQPTGVTPGYSYSTVNQSLLPTAPDPQSTMPLALAIEQQQNVSQQQQHQQVQDHQLQQPTRVTPGYSYSTVNQALLPTAPALQSTRPPGYSYSTVNQALLPTAPALQSTKPSYL